MDDPNVDSARVCTRERSGSAVWTHWRLGKENDFDVLIEHESRVVLL